jgi:glucose/arabinose dehydrogenase
VTIHPRTGKLWTMEQPVYFWTPDVAPAGISFYTGRLFPAWQGDLFAASTRGQTAHCTF